MSTTTKRRHDPDTSEVDWAALRRALSPAQRAALDRWLFWLWRLSMDVADRVRDQQGRTHTLVRRMRWLIEEPGFSDDGNVRENFHRWQGDLLRWLQYQEELSEWRRADIRTRFNSFPEGDRP